MPGLTLVHNTEDSISARSVLASLAAVPTTRVSPELSHDLLYACENTVLTISHYPGYPWHWVENERVQVALEGHIYGYGSSNSDPLCETAYKIISSSSIADAVASWLPTIDGDFVLWIRSKESGRMVLLNDVLGRLPLYSSRCQSSNEATVSRTVQVASHRAGAQHADSHAMAEVLLFGYPLGSRTLFDGVHRLAPATIVLPQARTTVSVLDPINREHSSHHRPLSTNAYLLAERFQRACKQRASVTSSSVLALSGGLDSRSVLAGLHRSSDTDALHGITFAQSDESNAEDVNYAESIANTFGIPWSLVTLAAPSVSARQTLLHLKGGLNSLQYSFMVDFLYSVRSKFGSTSALFTGDGGDKMLPDLRPALFLPNASAFLSYLIRVQGQMPLKTAAALVGFCPSSLANHLLDHITSYPASTWTDRYTAFLLRERAFSGFAEGEDRNRHFLWHMAPFYAWPVVALSLEIPSSQKSHERLYEAFLCALDPQLKSVSRSDHARAKPGSPLYRLIIRLRHLIHQYPSLHASLRYLRHGSGSTDVNAGFATLIRDQANSCPAIRSSLSVDSIDRILSGQLPTSTQGVQSLLTLTSFLESYTRE